MGPLTWVIFGALAGWVASLLVGNSERQGCIMNIVVGIVGAFLGGLLIEFTTGQNMTFEFSLGSFVVAVIGSVVLLVLVGVARSRS